MNVVSYLKSRGLITQNSPELDNFLLTKRKFYLGFEPSAPSLHLGNLLPLVIARHMIKFGHKPYILIGGATARIGDPSGKDKERVLSTLR